MFGESGFDYFGENPRVLKAMEDLEKKYGTTNQDVIKLIENYNEKNVEAKSTEIANTKAEDVFNQKKKDFEQAVTKKVEAKYIKKKAEDVSQLSPFISNSIMVNGCEVSRDSFIKDSSDNDFCSDGYILYFDAFSSRWFARVKNGRPIFISTFVVVACIVVDATGPGSCRAMIIFLKDSDNPLIFWEGVITPSKLYKQTTFSPKGLNFNRNCYYFQSFVRALALCNNVFFMQLPRHGGWNISNDGLLKFVCSDMMNPNFEALFYDADGKRIDKHQVINPFGNIVLLNTKTPLEKIGSIYHNALKVDIHVKIATAISIMSRFLPFFQNTVLFKIRDGFLKL